MSLLEKIYNSIEVASKRQGICWLKFKDSGDEGPLLSVDVDPFSEELSFEMYSYKTKTWERISPDTDLAKAMYLHAWPECEGWAGLKK